jgi:hypothetical protein
MIYLSYRLQSDTGDTLFFSFPLKVLSMETLNDYMKTCTVLDVFCFLLTKEPDGFDDFPLPDGRPLYDRAFEYFDDAKMHIFVETTMGLYLRGVRNGFFEIEEDEQEQWPDTITV